jgi:hypothetical protein
MASCLRLTQFVKGHDDANHATKCDTIIIRARKKNNKYYFSLKKVLVENRSVSVDKGLFNLVVLMELILLTWA